MAASDPPETENTETPPVDELNDEQVDSDTPEEGSETKLDLEVSVEERSACERHIAVTVARAEIERYYNKQFSELVGSAQVPGFRTGHAPRKLIEARFRKELKDQVKSTLLMDSIAQVNEQEKLSAISEPDFKLDAVELPDEGPMTFEFDLEVRPDFDLPNWKGLKLEKPVRDFDDKDVDEALDRVLARHGQLIPRDEAAELGDYITANLSFSHDGNVLSSAEEEVIRIRPTLSFRDGVIEKFDELMVGVKTGDTRETVTELTEDAPNQALRGSKVTATFEILEVKQLELPELTTEFLESMGDFESEADLRDAVLDNLKRQLEYEQHQIARDQVTSALTEAAEWDLPPSLLESQSQRELSRAKMELQRSGFSEEEIRAHENELRQHSNEATAESLKEHFILEKIAEEEEITDEELDYEVEIQLIAAQSGETPRRVRAQLEKSDRMDMLRNQIIERKVLKLVLDAAQFEEVPYDPESNDAEALDRAAGGGEPESDIPEAQPENLAEETDAEEAGVEEAGEEKS